MSQHDGEKQGVELKGYFDRDSVVGFLQDLVDSLKKEDSVYIRNEDSFITLTPADQIEVAILASQESENEQFHLKMAWERTGEQDTSELSLRISSSEPALEDAD